MILDYTPRGHSTGPSHDGTGHGLTKSESLVMACVDRGMARKAIALETGLKPSYIHTIIARFSDDLGKRARRKSRDGSDALLAAMLAMAA